MRKRRWAYLLLVLCVLGASAPWGAAAAQPGAEEDGGAPVKAESRAASKAQVYRALQEAKRAERDRALKPGPASIRLVLYTDGRELTGELVKAGVRVVQKVKPNVYVVTVGTDRADKILNIPGILQASVDKIYKLDPRELADAETRGADGEARPQLATTLDDTNVAAFRKTTGYTGKGVTIAVLDTGIDPDHEMLRATADGRIKIVDWQDFTTEGNVTVKPVAAGDGMVAVGDQAVRVPEVWQGKPVYVGELYEGILPNERLFGYAEGESTGFDFNLDGDKKDRYAVILADADGDGRPETVAVDTNQNGDVTDETPLLPYREAAASGQRSVAAFPSKAGHPEQRVQFVFTRLLTDASGNIVGVNLGWDGHSHGTHVAGIAAGSSAETGLTGVAPDAQLMAIKVLGSNVGGALSHIVEGMIYAAQNGADVVNMSLGSSPDINDGSNLEALVADWLSQTYGTVFAISAGNSGPGVNTIGAPGDSTAAVTSGAYIAAETWRANYGVDIPGEMLWYFSSIGPREDGWLKPTIVAPGSASSSVPTWMEGSPYRVYQGTSMSSPHTAGILALLTQAARAEGLVPTGGRLDPAVLARAVRSSARPVPGYQPAEQGGGLIDVQAAWAFLKAHRGQEPKRVTADVPYSEKLPHARGIYVRNGEVPRKVTVTLRSEEPRPVSLRVSADAPWVQVPKAVTIPAERGKKRPGTASLPVTLNTKHLAPGFYSSVIRLDDGDGVTDLEIPVSVVVPVPLDAQIRYTYSDEASVPTAKYKRYFFRVPHGVEKAVITLQVARDAAGRPLGRLKPMVYTPDGLLYRDAPYVGLGSADDVSIVEIPHPQPGVWEVDVYASHGQAGPEYRLAAGRYALKVQLHGVIAEPDQWTLTVAPGAVRSETFTFTNRTGRELTGYRVWGTGLVDLSVDRSVKQVLVFDQGDPERFDVFLDTFSVAPDNPNVVFEAAIRSLTNPAGDDYDLYLLNEAGEVIAYDADGDADEAIRVIGLPPGTYTVLIDNFATPSGHAEIEYRKALVNASDAEPNTAIAVKNLGTNAVPPDGKWRAVATVKVPTNKRTSYAAFLVVEYGAGRTLVPVTVSTEGTGKTK